MQVALVAQHQREALIDLLLEVHRYYNPGSSTPREVVQAHVAENLLAPQSPHRLVVATRADGIVVGLAAIAVVYSLVDPEPERRAHCQLKELFVSDSERGKGVGHALMAWVASYARARGCHRMDWPVKASNARGIAFYEGLGAMLVQDRLSYRLSEPHVGQLAARAGRPRSGA